MDKSDKKRILLKVGTNVLTKETNQISRGKIEDIARQIASLKEECEFVIVSSGAIAVAKQFVKLESNGMPITEKQALASIGQPHLMRIFHDNFWELGLLTSQCLLSYSDFKKEESRKNIMNTMNVLIKNKYIPIINENDTVATDEIKFGDNDKLSSLTASLLDVDLLIIATNTNGIYTKSSIDNRKKETIHEVSDIETLKEQISNSKSAHGTGGMKTKVKAAKIAQKANIETWVVNGLEDNFITNAFENKSVFTKIKSN